MMKFKGQEWKVWKRPATVTGHDGPLLFMRQDTLKHTLMLNTTF